MDSLETKKRKAPPIPKFEDIKSQQQDNNLKLQSKLNDFLTSVIPSNPSQIIPTKKVQQKDKKKSTLADINSKLNSMLNSKKLKLNQIQQVKNPSINPSKSVSQSQTKNRRYLNVEYDPSLPNNYDNCKSHYLSFFQSLIQKPQIKMSQVEQMEEQPIVQDQLEEKEQIALRMMQKLGYKVGQGLGRNGQGIRTPLTVKKTTDSSCIIQPSAISLQQIIRPQVSARNILQAFGIKQTKVIVIVNIVKLEDLTDDIEKQIKQQCQYYGQIDDWIIYMMGSQIRIFVKYKTIQQAFQAFLKLNNLYFYENLTSIRFYNQQSFQKYHLNEQLHQHLSF